MMNERRMWMTLAAGVLMLEACAAGRGYPLYPNAEAHQPPPERVAILDGYVASVDGRDVSSHGPSFELLPGCHVVVTPAQWGDMTPNSGVVMNTGRLYFAVIMKAGHRYRIEFGGFQSTVAEQGQAQLRASEMSPEGSITRTFAPTGVQEALEYCKSWQPEAAAPPSAGGEL